MSKGMGGTVGSKANMWSQSRACMARATASTSLAIGPGDDSTNFIRRREKKRSDSTMRQVAKDGAPVAYPISALERWVSNPWS